MENFGGIEHVKCFQAKPGVGGELLFPFGKADMVVTIEAFQFEMGGDFHPVKPQCGGEQAAVIKLK